MTQIFFYEERIMKLGGLYRVIFNERAHEKGIGKWNN